MEIEQPGSALIESRVNLMLEMNNKRLEQKFTSMSDTISALAVEIDRLKGELQNFSETKARKVVHVVQEKQKALKTEQQTPHPKQGKFTPSDVSMDKMFYYGRK